MLNAIISSFSLIEPATGLLYIFMLLSAIAFPIARNILKKKGKSLTVWVICSFIPLVLCILHLMFHIYDGSENLTFELFASVYIVSVFFPLLVPLRNKKALFHISASIFGVIIFGGTLYSLLSLLFFTPAVRNFSQMSYTDSYRAAIQYMKEAYVLSEWKEIDYDAIDAEIYPMIEEAEKENDPVKFYIAIDRLAYLIPDGHVMADPYDMDLYLKACEQTEGNDYGFIMFTLADGKTEAFMVDEDSDAYKNGITSGTVITSWDGVPINEAVENTCVDNFNCNFPVAENEDFLKALALAGKGGDKVTVGFLTKDGTPKTVTLAKRGGYGEKMSFAVGRLADAYFSDPENYLADNFSTKMLTDEIGYLKIVNEDDENLHYAERYPEITEKIKGKLTDLQNKGMKQLVIDLRNNSGGVGELSVAIASVFTDSTDAAYYEGGTKKAQWLRTPHYFYGDGSFKDLPVTVMTNFSCASAGDMLTKFFGNCDNIKIVGMTVSNGSAQPSGGICMLPDGMRLRFPAYYSYDENNEIEIDTKADRKSRIPIDEKIPVDETLAKGLFETEYDVELDYVLDHYVNQ